MEKAVETQRSMFSRRHLVSDLVLSFLAVGVFVLVFAVASRLALRPQTSA